MFSSLPVSQTGRDQHGGFTLIELIIAALLLGMLATVLLPTFGHVTTQQRTAAQSQAALEELSGLLEVFRLRPFEELTAESLKEFQVSPELDQLLTDAKLTSEVTSTKDDPGHRVTLKLTWIVRGSSEPASVQLSAWVYPTTREED